MKRTKSEPARPQRMELAKQYRAIGPAAIQAALICVAKKRKRVHIADQQGRLIRRDGLPAQGR